METTPSEVNPIKKDLRKLLLVVFIAAVIFGTVEYLARNTTYIKDISRNIYKATLENS